MHRQEHLYGGDPQAGAVCAEVFQDGVAGRQAVENQKLVVQQARGGRGASNATKGRELMIECCHYTQHGTFGQNGKTTTSLPEERLGQPGLTVQLERDKTYLLKSSEDL